jgi:hypothetical protein
MKQISQWKEFETKNCTPEIEVIVLSPLFEVARVLARLDHGARFNRRRSGEVQRIPQPVLLKRKARAFFSSARAPALCKQSAINLSYLPQRQPTVRVFNRNASERSSLKILH